MTAGEHVLNALQLILLAALIVTLGRELPKAARRAWRMARLHLPPPQPGG